MDPSGKGASAMLKPATLVLVGLASAAAIAHAFRAPFPGPGGNPVLDLIAYHDPGFHTVIRVWYYVAPAVAVVLFGSLGLSVWRVWLQPRAGAGGRGKLPPWPASPEDETPSLVIGELHHPVVPRESERPSWLVVPETGLYTGVLIVGAVGSGKTSACMHPFAEQLLSWQADRPARRASALVLEVKGDFCHDVRRILEEAGRGDDYLGIGPRWCLAVEPARRSSARHLFARLQRRLPDQPRFPSAIGDAVEQGLIPPLHVDGLDDDQIDIVFDVPARAPRGFIDVDDPRVSAMLWVGFADGASTQDFVLTHLSEDLASEGRRFPRIDHDSGDATFLCLGVACICHNRQHHRQGHAGATEPSRNPHDDHDRLLVVVPANSCWDSLASRFLAFGRLRTGDRSVAGSPAPEP